MRGVEWSDQPSAPTDVGKARLRQLLRRALNSARERTRTSTAKNGHMALNHARLPIPPLGQGTKCEFWNLERGVMFRYAPEAHLLIPHSGVPSRTVTPAGFEPATHGLKVRCSARLSYEVGLLQRHLCVCHPGASVRGAGREAFVRLTRWRGWRHRGRATGTVAGAHARA